MLCNTHESAFGMYDDYGVEFVRAVRDMPFPSKAPSTRLTNKFPDRLKLFFLGLIWRKNLSNIKQGGSCGLGPYATAIAEAVFENKPIKSPLILMRGMNALNNERVPILVEPHRVNFADRHAWKCELGWLTGLVILDRRGLRSDWRQVDAAESKMATIMQPNPVDMTDRTDIRHILDQMDRRR